MINATIVLCGVVFLFLGEPVKACAFFLLAIFWKLDEIYGKMK